MYIFAHLVGCLSICFIYCTTNMFFYVRVHCIFVKCMLKLSNLDIYLPRCGLCVLKGISISRGVLCQTPLNPFIIRLKNIKSHVSNQGGEKLFCVISLARSLLSALPFMSVIVGDYFNREKGSR